MRELCVAQGGTMEGGRVGTGLLVTLENPELK